MAQAAAIRQRVRGIYWLELSFGGLLALLAVLLTPLAYLLKLLVAFVHEVGHSLIGWLFGYPSIPTIDLFYGGGVTIQWNRQLWLCVLTAMVIAWLAWRQRHNRIAGPALAGLLAAYTIISLTPAQEVAVLVSGHLAELAFAGFLLFRVMQGLGVSGSLERAFLAAFILIEDVRFSYLLVTNAAVRQDYEGANVIGFKMDFTRLASEYLGIDVGIIALTFLFCCVLTPAVAFLAFRYRAVTVDPVLARLSLALKPRA